MTDQIVHETLATSAVNPAGEECSELVVAGIVVAIWAVDIKPQFARALE